MSKVGQWVMEMQEDAYDMTEAEFIKVHGASNRSVWESVHNPDPTEFEPEDYYYEGEATNVF